MKKKLLLGLSLSLVVFAVGCSSEQSKSENLLTSASTATASPSSDLIESGYEERNTEVKALHLNIKIPAEWSIRGGEESFGFMKGSIPVGGLDGLGYAESESIDSLLPNGAIVDLQETLEGFPVQTVRATLTIEERGSEGKREEIHYFYFLRDAKAIYDLRFDANQVTLEQSEKIAKTAVIS